MDRQMDSSTFQPSFGPSMETLCHPGFTTPKLSYRFPIFETSATTLRGTTGNTELSVAGKAAKRWSAHIM
jgi:hypothetical protein